jgi:D-proline reductase (dithiol) PrdB
LVQNAVEGMGVSTISMSVQPHITASIGVPRGIALRFPAGNQVGEAGKPQQQRMILTAALEAIGAIESPGTIVELPYRWRRFPVHEEPVIQGSSQGPRHPQAEAIGDALDQLVHAAQVYKTYMEARLAREEANPLPPDQAAAGAYRLQLNRIDQFLTSLDGEILDQLRDIVNAVAVMELRAAGKFV